jgi:hypothetical protein
MYNDFALAALAKEHEDVSFVHQSPGFVKTNWCRPRSPPLLICCFVFRGTEMPWYLKGPIRVRLRCLPSSHALSQLMQKMGASPATVAEYNVYSLCNPETKGVGLLVVAASPFSCRGSGLWTIRATRQG